MDEDADLDELLDEVEQKFCRNVSVSSSARVDPGEAGECGRDNAGRIKHKTTSPGLAADIDVLLEELLAEDFPQLKREAFPEGPQVETKPSAQSGGRKCCPVFVGGSAVASGVGTATSKRSCDQLRCTSCDFRVLTFDDRAWDPSCDYLFLRNNVPDREKLGARLRRSGGSRAFACQCSWFSADEPTDLREQPRLRWVCGKHQA
uniref:protein C8orf37 homolog n=1 Tax=Gasterosteus aculeatus aculeatus TaxID=481459 RepID=UPI001A98B61D|nr:protein C8orf37 homolog [Gasterosteus aculeatus aculeatus]